jgi:hypothetical protein
MGDGDVHYGARPLCSCIRPRILRSQRDARTRHRPIPNAHRSEQLVCEPTSRHRRVSGSTTSSRTLITSNLRPRGIRLLMREFQGILLFLVNAFACKLEMIALTCQLSSTARRMSEANTSRCYWQSFQNSKFTALERIADREVDRMGSCLNIYAPASASRMYPTRSLPKFPISMLGLPPKHVPSPAVKLAPQPTLQSGMIDICFAKTEKRKTTHCAAIALCRARKMYF